METLVKFNHHHADLVGLVARLAIGGVMLAAGAIKLADDPAASVRAVRAYELLPETLVPTVGYMLPIIEVMLGSMLIAGMLTRGVAVATAALQVAFIGGIAWAWANGLQIDCGCFGGGGAKENASDAYPFDIARDVGFVVLAMLAWKWPARRWSVDRYVLLSKEPMLAHDQSRRDALATDAPSTNRGDTE